jgi:hypothetical protein
MSFWEIFTLVALLPFALTAGWVLVAVVVAMVAAVADSLKRR